MKQWFMLVVLLLTGCTAVPEGVKPVAPFEAERYLGQWYEIARLDHWFERGLSRVTATYSRRDDGGLRVINRGYAARDRTWKEAEGRAYFLHGPDQGALKVSFFGPFYGAYMVLALDRQHYQYALVCGPDRSYLWILARTPQLDPKITAALVAQAAALGFATDKLLWVEQH